MKSRTFSLSIALLFTGCAGSPAQLAMLSAEQLQTVELGALCNAYTFSGHNNGKLRAELKRRDQALNEMKERGEPINREPFTDREWESIQSGTIFIGMSEPALWCSWGGTGIYGTINESVGSWGVHRQYVYRNSSYSSGQYVYVENGEVTSWQN